MPSAASFGHSGTAVGLQAVRLEVRGVRRGHQVLLLEVPRNVVLLGSPGHPRLVLPVEGAGHLVQISRSGHQFYFVGSFFQSGFCVKMCFLHAPRVYVSIVLALQFQAQRVLGSP